MGQNVDEEGPLIQGPPSHKKLLKSENTNRMLSYALVIALIAGVSVAVYLAYYRTYCQHKLDSVCTTPACVELAGDILSAMNSSVEPCTDFYHYACGGWIESHVLPDYLGRLVTFSILEELNNGRLREKLSQAMSSGSELNSTAIKKAKNFYRACMNTSASDAVGTLPVDNIIKALGGWSVQSSTFNPGTWDMQTALTGMAATFQNTPFFAIDVSPDQKNTRRNLITISQGGLGMASASYYALPLSSPQVTAYRTYMAAAFQLFGASKADAATLMNGVFQLEKELASVMLPPAEVRDPYAIYNLLTVSKISAEAAPFDFLEIFKKMFPDTVSTKITANTEIIVQVPINVVKVAAIVEQYNSDTSKRVTLANYMMWISVSPYLQHLGSDFRRIFAAYTLAMEGTEPAARSETCVELTDAEMGFATGRMFIDSYFSQSSKTEVMALIMSIKTAFKDNLKSLTWMDDATKTLASEKVDAVLPIIAYPDFITNNTLLDEAYENTTINASCLICNVLETDILGRKDELDGLFDPVDRGAWEMTADTVNAYYDPDFNDIVFPAGILQMPFYQGDYQKVVKYGRIGAVMGHELTHGFDDQGSQYDKEGNLKKWWPAAVREKFTEKTECVAEQYSTYSIDGHHVNGNLTLGENIADHGGLKMAFNAYKAWQADNPPEQKLPGLEALSSEQLFFLAYAQLWCAKSTKEDELRRLLTDPHSPPRFRVIGTLSTSNAFVSAWKCPAGSPMNRADKCVVW